MHVLVAEYVSCSGARAARELGLSSFVRGIMGNQLGSGVDQGEVGELSEEQQVSAD